MTSEELELPPRADRTADGWLFAHWLLQEDGKDKAEQLGAQLQAAARQCSEEAATAHSGRASDLVCGAWAADLASRLLTQIQTDFQKSTWAQRRTELAARLNEAASASAHPPAWPWLDTLLNTFMGEARNLPAILEKIGLAAFWLGRPRDGAALINGSATLRGGTLHGAMAEVAAWRTFGHAEEASETLRCAARMLEQIANPQSGVVNSVDHHTTPDDSTSPEKEHGTPFARH